VLGGEIRLNWFAPFAFIIHPPFPLALSQPIIGAWHVRSTVLRKEFLMKVNSHNHAFTKKLRQLIAILIAGLFIFASVNAGAGAIVSIADTLGVATPATQFIVFGATGFIFFSVIYGGVLSPRPQLTQPLEII
jgi:hypothetical protein